MCAYVYVYVCRLPQFIIIKELQLHIARYQGGRIKCPAYTQIVLLCALDGNYNKTQPHNLHRLVRNSLQSQNVRKISGKIRRTIYLYILFSVLRYR